MAVKILLVLVFATSFVWIQGCCYSHTKETVVHDRPDAQTTTVYHEHPASETVDVTTTH
jgi:hypothetical protein